MVKPQPTDDDIDNMTDEELDNYLATDNYRPPADRTAHYKFERDLLIFGVIAGLVIPILGVVLAIVAVAKGNVRMGAAITLISLIGFLIWANNLT